jgi:acetyltransferase-like isoleucine patch superfamily enzyme
MMQDVRMLARCAWYRLRFAGRNVRVHPSARVAWRSVLRTNGGGSITIGARCEIHDFAMLLTYGGDISLGDDCSVNPFSIIYGHGGTRIGRGVRIAAHAVIIPANHVRADGGSGVLSGIEARGITIDDDVWIACGCRILDGVRIGRQATIGAGSVVSRSIPEKVVAVGAPARPIKKPGGGELENPPVSG